MRKSSPSGYRTGSFRRYLILLFLIPLGYLFHVCVFAYLRIGSISPNLLFAVIGIITVAYGRLQALWAGLIYGLLMEILVPSVTYFSLAVYPISALFVSFVFADKSLRQLQLERAMDRTRHGLPAWVRTILCAMVNTLVYETVNVAYIYLGGTDLTARHFIRAALSIVLTGLLTLAIEFPLRRLILGKKKEEVVLKNQPIVFSKK